MEIRLLKMDMQLEKMKLIEWLVGLQDKVILKRLEELRSASELSSYEAGLKPMSIEELKARAKESNRAIAAGHVIDIENILGAGSEG